MGNRIGDGWILPDRFYYASIGILDVSWVPTWAPILSENGTVEEKPSGAQAYHAEPWH